MGTAMRERDLSSRAVCVPLGPQVWRRGCGSRLPARSLETRGNEAPHSRHLILLHFTNDGRRRRGRDDLVVLEQFTAQLANFLATQHHAPHTFHGPYLGRPVKLHVEINGRLRNNRSSAIRLRDNRALLFLGPVTSAANTSPDFNTAKRPRILKYIVDHICEPISPNRSTSDESSAPPQGAVKTPLSPLQLRPKINLAKRST
jgi:hypothetical protein